MNLERIDYVIIAIILVLAIYVFCGCNSKEGMTENFAPAPATNPNVKGYIDSTQKEINNLNNQIKNAGDARAKYQKQRDGLSMSLRSNPKLKKNKKWMVMYNAQMNWLNTTMSNLNNTSRAKKDAVGHLTKRINMLKKTDQSWQQINRECQTSNDSLKKDNQNLTTKLTAAQASLVAAQNAAQTAVQTATQTAVQSAIQTTGDLADQDLDTLVEMTVTKIVEEIMSRADGLNWEDVAVRTGNSVENAIKQYSQNYQNVDKTQMAKMLARQVRVTVNGILREIDQGVSELNNSAPALPVDPLPPVDSVVGEGIIRENEAHKGLTYGNPGNNTVNLSGITAPSKPSSFGLQIGTPRNAPRQINMSKPF